MFKSIESTDQDDFFDFLRVDDDPMGVGHNWSMKKPSEMKPGISADPILHPFSGIGSENKKRTDTFS